MKLDPKVVKRWKRGQEEAQKIILDEIRQLTITEKLDQLAGLMQFGYLLRKARIDHKELPRELPKESIKDREAAWKTWAALRKASRRAQ